MIDKAKIAKWSIPAIAAVTVVLAGYNIHLMDTFGQAARKSANDILATKCIKTPDGRTLHPIFMDKSVSIGGPRSHYHPAVLTKDKETGKPIIGGYILTVEDRLVEQWATRDIKIVECRKAWQSANSEG